MHLALDRHFRNVFVEVMPIDSAQCQILQLLSSNPLRADAHNHTIPHVKFIPAGNWMFVSQACWGDTWNWPCFDTIRSRLEMARQVIEGVAFMHENRIGHGDLHPHNIVFNHDNMRTLEVGEPAVGAPIAPFHSTFDFRMAFIDFECAVHFEEGVLPLVRAHSLPPSDIAAPEQLDGGAEKYNMFAADVYSLGRTLQKELKRARVDKHPAAFAPSETYMEYEKLLGHMTKQNPSERLTAAEAYKIIVAML